MITRLLTWKELAILGGLASALLVGSVTVYVMRGKDTRERENAPVLRTASRPPVSAEDKPEPLETEPPRPEPQSVVIDSGTPSAPIAPLASSPILPPARGRAQIVVEVKGAVMRPGVYELVEDARIEDALVQAGGTEPDADLSDINRAAKLIDAAPLYIPRAAHITYEGGVAANRPEASAAEMNPPEYTISGWRRTTPVAVSAGKAAVPGLAAAEVAPATSIMPGGLVDLNTATREQLKALPRVGDVTADKIIAYRQQTPFTQVEDLLNISGIGDKTLETLRPLITANPLQ